jgi:hypothetical protein
LQKLVHISERCSATASSTTDPGDQRAQKPEKLIDDLGPVHFHTSPPGANAPTALLARIFADRSPNDLRASIFQTGARPQVVRACAGDPRHSEDVSRLADLQNVEKKERPTNGTVATLWCSLLATSAGSSGGGGGGGGGTGYAEARFTPPLLLSFSVQAPRFSLATRPRPI